MNQGRWYLRAYGNIIVAVGAIFAQQLVAQPLAHAILTVIVGFYAGAGCCLVIMWPVLHPEMPFRRVLRIATGREELP